MEPTQPGPGRATALIVSSTLACAALLTLYGCGDNNGGGGGGPGVGTISGVVINSETTDAIEGVSVVLDPPIADISIVTDRSGAYSQALPIGVYTLSFDGSNYDPVTRTISVSASQNVTINAALTPIDPVVVTAGVDGMAAPGASLTGSVDVEVFDGSATVQSYSWTQSNSVEVTITGANTATPTIGLPDTEAYRDELILVLSEPPIMADDLPPNVPLPEGEFPGGLQDRWQVVGMSPFALEETGLVTLEVTVTTTSGTFTDVIEIHAELPWRPAAGIHDVPIGLPVQLHGKTQSSYNWAISSRPSGSSAALTDATSQSPWFTPDASGLYTLSVTDRTGDANEQVAIGIYAGTWQGAITGQNAEGRPLAANCTTCHNDAIAPDIFTPWMETGHAEIFTNNLNTNDHYSTNCFPCHTVGYEPAVANNGIDDQSDYMAFLDSGLIPETGPNQWTMMLADFPASAQFGNVQCENCHGPNNGGAHTQGEPRYSLSSDVCATCHGEPLRHARFQQWQLSGHANYELAIEEGESGNCSRCHTANGFLAWLPILNGDVEGDPFANVEVTWTRDETHPQTCVTCHDPHMIGTTSGNNTNATVRISGDTPPLIAGFQAIGVGKGAICMTCHNSRRGLRNDETYDATTAAGDASRAPHPGPQADVIMGQNAYLVETGIRGNHSLVDNTCVDCHMEQTDPPNVLSYNLGGANHTFFASNTICMNCHEEIGAQSVQSAFEASSDELLELIESAEFNLIDDLTTAGNTIDLNGEATITDADQIVDLVFGEFRGRQSLTFTLTDGMTYGPLRVNDIDVLSSGVVQGNLYDFADERLVKAGWNYNLGHNDGSHGVHNPTFVFGFLDAGIDALRQLSLE